jgi:hypothetical protein
MKLDDNEPYSNEEAGFCDNCGISITIAEMVLYNEHCFHCYFKYPELAYINKEKEI